MMRFSPRNTFEVGAQAHDDGVYVTDNPYPEGSAEAMGWLDGWNFAAEQATDDAAEHDGGRT